MSVRYSRGNIMIMRPLFSFRTLYQHRDGSGHVGKVRIKLSTFLIVFEDYGRRGGGVLVDVTGKFGHTGLLL